MYILSFYYLSKDWKKGRNQQTNWQTHKQMILLNVWKLPDHLSKFCFKIWLLQLLGEVQINSTKINLSFQSFYSSKWLLKRRNSVCACVYVCVHVWMLSHSVVSDSVTPLNIARQAPLSVEFSRQEYWSEPPFLRDSVVANNTFHLP